MKKINLKINTLEINVLLNLSSLEDNSVLQDTQRRVARSILLPVFKRLTGRSINTHPANYKMSFKLSYHEAYYLEMFLQDFNANLGVYEWNVVLQLKNFLNKELT
ncbi:hypothetical protein AWE51_00105 [Aquimarina aggregata]|uniref:Uncharacterized protein n=1 Tax=Aquimarina aggregata TaxID=1642818 RepID=A0A163BXV9_9FLAO|nr:hypothetical protein [Aquimarina aggregata]KZS41883.1 hypothetical protein AWE51_00105 [Aquimarina aggregata]